MATAPEPSLFVGVDWATRTHEVCVLDGSRKTRGKRSVPNSPTGLDELCHWLLKLTDNNPAILAVAIERPDGPVVETLLDFDIPVYAVNPKQLDRFRDRHCLAGAKDDRRDARVLADSLRTDRHLFRQVAARTERLVALRGLVRSDDELRTAESQLGNRLREYLGRYFPQMLELAADRASPFLWDLWEAAPTPKQAARLNRRTIAGLLRRHHIRRLTVERVLAALRSPALRVSTATTDATVAAIGLLLPQLRLVHAQRRDCGSRIAGLLKAEMAPPKGKAGQHSDATILDSLPGIGRAVLARMLTEGAEAIRHRDLNRLRALGGSAPVTKRSGKSCRVEMRRACNPRLRFAYYHWARIAVQKDAHCQRHYQALRARGHSHGRALRSVVDRLLAVAVAMLKKGTLYDPSLRGQGRSGKVGVVTEPQATPENTK